MKLVKCKYEHPKIPTSILRLYASAAVTGASGGEVCCSRDFNI